MNTPADDRILIRGLSYRKVGKKIVPVQYAYMAARSTLFDGQLIEWANARERKFIDSSKERNHAT